MLTSTRLCRIALTASAAFGSLGWAAPVLAEVCRSPKLDAAVNRVLGMKGIVVAELTERIARRAGHLLARARLASDHAVDAFVVATALDFPDSLIATGDVGDIERLAAGFKQVRTFRI